MHIVRLGVADLTVEVRTADPCARDNVLVLCGGFLSEGEPVAVVHLQVGDPDTWSPPSGACGDGLQVAQPGLRICADSLLRRVDACVDADNLYWLVLAVLRTVYCNLTGLRQGVALHAAGVVRNERAYVFVGPSGSGKTTVARLSEAHAVLDDDLVLVRRTNGAFAAHSNPGWARSMPAMDEPRRFELAGVYCLRQGSQPALKSLEPAIAAAQILVLPAGATQLVCDALLTTCDELAREVPCYELTFARDNRFWELMDRGS